MSTEHLPLDAIVEWTRGTATCVPSEHNRSALAVNYERIQSSERMANGTLRQYYVADKRSWSLSWDMLPAPSEETVDGKAGGRDIERFYLATPGVFTMKIKHADSNLDETVTVVFSSFDKTHVRRGKYDFWDISVGLDQV